MKTRITTKPQQNVNRLCFPDEIRLTVTKQTNKKTQQTQTKPEQNKAKSGN